MLIIIDYLLIDKCETREASILPNRNIFLMYPKAIKYSKNI